jgi:hypothetical protein
MFVPALQSAETTTVRDDFSAFSEASTATRRWLPVAGVWRVQQGVYAQEEHRFSETLSFMNEPVFSNLDFTVRFMGKDVGRGVKAAGMVFRAESTQDFYYVHFDSKNSQVVLVRCSRTNPWDPIKRASRVVIATGQWHTGRVKCEGTKIEVFLNDKKVIEAQDAAHPVGKIGLRVGQGVVQFDDVEVTGTTAALRRKWEKLPVRTPEIDDQARKAEGIKRVIATAGQGYFPVLIRMQNGELAAVVRGGAPHVGVGGRLAFIKSSDGGKTWSKPKTVADIPPDSRNPAFGQAPDGRLVIGFSVTGPYENGKFVGKSGDYTVWLTTSADNGTTWTEPRKLDCAPLKFGSPYGKIVVMPDGTMLMPVYEWPHPDGRRDASYLWRSRDNGKTWGDPSLIAKKHNETSLLPMPNQRLLAFLRNGGGTHQAESRDGGRTWTEPKRVLASGRHPSDVIRLANGHLLMVTGHRVIPYGVLAVRSTDAGESWDVAHRVLLDWQSGNTDCGYPSSAQLPDGTIVTLYYGVTHEAHPDLRAYCMGVRFREDALWPK